MPTPLIQMDGVSWRSGRRDVLRGVTIAIGRRDAVGIVGPNGSGKTTLLRLMVGLIEPGSGCVALDGERVPRGLGRCRVSYFGGWPTLPATVTASGWCSLFGVHTRCPWAGSRLGRLSPGLRQQAGLLASIGRDADLLVLDEPWDSLDVHASRWLSSRLHERREGGATLVVTSHRVQELLGVCTRIAFLSHGALREAGHADTSALTVEGLLAAYDRVMAG
jgi:ABC-type multidrug transport system ATPase subunit